MPKSNKPTRQEKLAHLDHAFKYVTEFHTAIDAGAHTGLWSARMAQKFKRVLAYEAWVENIARWEKTMEGYRNVALYYIALGDTNGYCRMEGEGHSKHYAVPDKRGNVQMAQLDFLVTGPVNLIKVDCEGADLLVLKGAEGLILKHKPVIIVEILHRLEKRYDIEEGELQTYMTSLGYRHRETHWCDHIYSPSVYIR